MDQPFAVTVFDLDIRARANVAVAPGHGTEPTQLHPQLGPIGPDEFIPLAEHSGVIGDLTTLVLRAALRECAGWRAGGDPLSVAVNVSTRSLTDPSLPARAVVMHGTASTPASAA